MLKISSIKLVILFVNLNFFFIILKQRTLNYLDNSVFKLNLYLNSSLNTIPILYVYNLFIIYLFNFLFQFFL